MWDRYIEDCHAIVFVADSFADAERTEATLRALSTFILECKLVFFVLFKYCAHKVYYSFTDKLMTFEHAHFVPLMLVYNKCDMLDDAQLALQTQQLRDVCQAACESEHRADIAAFSISALKSLNIERCRLVFFCFVFARFLLLSYELKHF